MLVTVLMNLQEPASIVTYIFIQSKKITKPMQIHGFFEL